MRQHRVLGAGAGIVFNISCRAYAGAVHMTVRRARRALTRTPTTLEKLAHVARSSTKQSKPSVTSRGVNVPKEKIYFSAVETDRHRHSLLRRPVHGAALPTGLERGGNAVSPQLTLAQQCLVLERNSYDLVRAPLLAHIAASALA